MEKPTIHIDGQEGTTGLRIREMLAPCEDVEVLLIPAAQRKDPQIRAEFLNRATKLIDTSTAH